MNRRALVALVFGFLLCAASTATAHAQETGAVGYWVGSVSWSETPVTYVWEIYADRTFGSDREGRGPRNGGAWGLRGTRLTLKYDDGFRYEGELSGDGYSGTAYGADGRVSGAFSMSRVTENSRPFDADEQD
ncbi:MAG: hypothetical protein ABL879_19490 [Devosia sp.]